MKHLFYLFGLVTVACLTGCVQTAAEDNPDQYSTETRIVTILDRTISRGRVYQRYAIDGLPAIYSVFPTE